MLIEIDGAKKNARKNYEKGLWNVWDNDRIRRAFNFGRGTMSDLIEYAKNNRQYCCIYDTEKHDFLV